MTTSSPVSIVTGAGSGIGRAVAIACDGTRTVDQIIDQMVAEAKSGALTVQVEGRPVTDDQQLRNILSSQVQ